MTDEMCKDEGIEMARLPPYHCEFNPIELVWATAKAGVKKRNVQYKLKNAMEIMREECLKCDAAYWLKVEKHAMKEEEIAGGGDQIVLSAIEVAMATPTIITFDSSSEEEEDSEEEDA